jgi:primase-polymerase (primpol)-like protein
MKQMPRWVIWFEMPADNGAGERLTKRPYQPSGKAASSADPSTWGTYDQARAGYRKLK